MLQTAGLTDAAFAEAEVRRLLLPDEMLEALCRRSVRTLLPRRDDAAPIVAEMLKQRLGERTPTSLLRIGDGEGNVLGLLAGAPHPILLASFNDQFQSQNGIRLAEEEARRVAVAMRDAMGAADIIGVRAFDGRAPESGVIARCLAAGAYPAALGIVYARAFLQDELAHGRFREKLITSAWIHLALIPYLADIIGAASDLLVISGRSELRGAFEARFGARLRGFIAVPPEATVPATAEDAHYRGAFPKVLDMLSGDLSGALVLVGAGYLGKLYCQAARNSGAVAVDLGSAFDVLAGVRTRPAHARIDIDALRWL